MQGAGGAQVQSHQGHHRLHRHHRLHPHLCVIVLLLLHKCVFMYMVSLKYAGELLSPNPCIQMV